MSISLSEAVTNTSLGGHLQLVCSHRPGFGPYISSQDFRVPVHIGKGFLDSGTLVLNIANPTAGFFDGDRIDMDVRVAPQARLCLSTPAASRVYPTRSGKPARTRQIFRVENEGLLEWMPEPFIPHAGASYHQETEIHLDAGASLFFLEWIAPGRVAMGETFAYQRLCWDLDLSRDGVLCARERNTLVPGTHSLEALTAFFPAAHYVSVFVSGDLVRNWPADDLDAMNSASCYLGHGPLPGGVCVIRALCKDSISARNLVSRLRVLLYESSGQVAPALGRVPA